MRAGGGVINLPRADNPLVFAAPVALSFGLVGPTATQTQQVDLTDAGGGAGGWAVSLDAAVGGRPRRSSRSRRP